MALRDDGPTIVSRWKDNFGWLETSIGAGERVAHQLEGVSLRQGRQPRALDSRASFAFGRS